MLRRDEEVGNPLASNLRGVSQKKPSVQLVQLICLTIDDGKQ
jgi:hypothetical protein